MKTWICLILLAAAVVSSLSARAAGIIIITDPDVIVVPPRPLPPRPVSPPFRPPLVHVFAPLEVNSQKIATHITDQVAVTSVDEEFYNPNPRRLEGTFVFPIPKGAQIDKFTMEIDGRQVQAELLAADKARGIYEDIVRRPRRPGADGVCGPRCAQSSDFPH